MPIIIPFDTGWTIAQHMIDKLIYLILLWSWIFHKIMITSLHSLVNYVCNIVWNHLPDWKSTPPVRRDKNRDKTGHVAGRFSRKLYGCKNQATMNATVNQGGMTADILS